MEFFNSAEIASSSDVNRSPRNDEKGSEILSPVLCRGQNNNEEKFNLRSETESRPASPVGGQTSGCTKDRLLHSLVLHYQKKPARKPWVMSLLLVISWKQMEYTYSRFGYEMLKQINPFDPFATVYESYIDAFLEVPTKHTPTCPSGQAGIPPRLGRDSTVVTLPRGDDYRFALRIKDRAEYLIKQELKECGCFKEYPEQEIPVSESLPWRFEIEQLIEEWQMNGVLSKRQANLVINHLIYEFTFKEMSKHQKISPGTISKRFQRALRTLTPYLQRKYFSEDGEFLGF